MPEWLQLRVAQCSLTFVDGFAEGDRISACCGVAIEGQQPSLTAARQDAVIAPAASNLQLQLPQSLARPSISSIRWQHIPVTGAPAPAVAVDPACGDTGPAFAPMLPFSGVATVAETTRALSPVTPALLAAAGEAVISTAAFGDAHQDAQGAGTPKPSKRHRKHRASSSASILSSPPKVYRSDQDYQRYLADSNDMSAWVRKTILDR
jgi:hypothetical protein